MSDADRQRARDELADYFGGNYNAADALVMHLHRAGLGVVPVDPADGLPMIDGLPAVQWAEDFARELLAESGWYDEDDDGYELPPNHRPWVTVTADARYL